MPCDVIVYGSPKIFFELSNYFSYRTHLSDRVLIKIPESRDSTLGAALWRPGSPWLRYLYEQLSIGGGLISYTAASKPVFSSGFIFLLKIGAKMNSAKIRLLISIIGI